MSGAEQGQEHLPPVCLEPRRSEGVMFARTMTRLDANLIGSVDGGIIMREVDTAAGIAAARHAGRVCVTAAIDELSFFEPVYVGDIVVVRARVNDAGRTSLEVGVRVEAEPWHGGERRHTTSAYLVMVALGDDGGPAPVPPLLAVDEQEQRRQQQARIRRQIRKERLTRLGSYGPGPDPAR
jgi:acyl-CoA hydrolase